MLPVGYYLFLSFGLFFIGVLGVLLRRNPAVIALSIGLMVTASAINFVAFSRFFGDPAGQDFALLLMIAALAEAVVLVSLIARRLEIQPAARPVPFEMDAQSAQVPVSTDAPE